MTLPAAMAADGIQKPGERQFGQHDGTERAWLIASSADKPGDGTPRIPASGPLHALLAELVPRSVDVRIALGPVSDHRSSLDPAEMAAIAAAAPRRVAEFSTGRHLARQAMIALGLDSGPVMRAEQRAPRWPAACIGSITHGRELAAAAVARRGALRGVGIDLEEASRVAPELYPKIFTAREREELDTRPTTRVREGTLRFSAKEAVYKAVNPRIGRFIGFREVEIVPDPSTAALIEGDIPGAGIMAAGRFGVRYVGDHAPNAIMDTGAGCYCYFGRYVLTLFLIP
jgi:4'-phosphopantetheinyl transferase EntD